MDFIETVKVEHKDDPTDYTIINKSEFDESKHTLFVEKPAKEPKPPKAAKDPKETQEPK